jgi:hypothetical protein
MSPRGGRGRWHSSEAIDNWLLDCMKRGLVINVVCEIDTKGEYKGVRQDGVLTHKLETGFCKRDVLHKALEKEGLKMEQANVTISELLRSGDLYEPREDFLKTTTDCDQIRKEVDGKAKKLDTPSFCKSK